MIFKLFKPKPTLYVRRKPSLLEQTKIHFVKQDYVGKYEIEVKFD